MPRSYTFHDQASHPDEWFCSTEQKWKPRSEFNLRDEANGLPHGIVATASKSEGATVMKRTKTR
jgi:hypothetical protein